MGKIVIHCSVFNDSLSIGTSAWKGTPLQRDDKLYFGSKEVQLVDQVKPSALPVDTGEPDPPEDEVLIVEDTSSVKKFATPLNTNGVAPAAFYGLAKKASGPLFVIVTHATSST